jgi:hypothetical protein
VSVECTICRKNKTDFNKYRCNECYAKELHMEEAKAFEEYRALESTIEYYKRSFEPLLSIWRLKNTSAKIRRLITESLALQAHMKGLKDER